MKKRLAKRPARAPGNNAMDAGALRARDLQAYFWLRVFAALK